MAIFAAVLVAVVSAQTLTVQLKPNTPFQIEWYQPDAEPALLAYRFWCNSAIVKNFAKAELSFGTPVNGETPITTTAPGLPTGTHSCFVSAVLTTKDAAGVETAIEAKGAPIPLTVVQTTGPGTPMRLRVVVTVGGGG